MTVQQAEIEQAVQALRRGELVAFPTETVYGLGADAGDAAAVRRIFAAKGRPADHPVIVHLAAADWLERWAAPVPPQAYRLAERFWPGPLTQILPRAAHVLDVVTGGQPTVGLRVPDHPVAHALLEAFGGGVAAPSANRFGRISPTRAEHVRAELGDAVALVLDGGPTRVGLESTIVDLAGTQPALLRPGFVGVAELEAVLERPLHIPSGEQPATRAPGTLASHYAPATPLMVVAPDELDATATRLYNAGQRIAVLARRPPTTHNRVIWRVAPPDAAGYGQQLYGALRELDALAGDHILVEAVPDGDVWLAVRDRLRRAANATQAST